MANIKGKQQTQEFVIQHAIDKAGGSSHLDEDNPWDPVCLRKLRDEMSGS